MLERDRACEIHSGDRYGSGYRITTTLILTAGHVVDDESDAMVSFLSDQSLSNDSGAVRVRPARVVWRAQGEHWRGTDAALLELTEDDAEYYPPPRWGVLVCGRPGVKCTALGFPDVQVSETDARREVREAEQLRGKINPLTKVKAGLLDIDVGSTTPAVWERDRPISRWRGMSGAAVFCGDLLTGVVIWDDINKFEGRRLTAIPTERLVQDENFRRLIGDATGRVPFAEPVELDDLQDVPAEPQSPAGLLRADVETVRFRGRHDLLDELHAWCTGQGVFAVRLLTAAGGQGKSRLGRELGRRMSRERWAVLHLAAWRPDATREAYRVVRELKVPLLIVVDYAESRTDQLTALAQSLVRRRREKVRLLLLARTKGDWLEIVAASAPGLEVFQLSTIEHTELPALSGTNGELGTEQAFTDAVLGLTERLSTLDGHRQIKWRAAAQRIRRPRMSPVRYANILEVQMTTLALLLDAAYPHTASEQSHAPGGAEDVLLLHERRYWTGMAETHELALEPPVSAGLVAIATLCTAAGPEEIGPVKAGLGILSERPSGELMTIVDRWLRDLYQARHMYWGSLQPDRLAERLVGRAVVDRPDHFDASVNEVSPRQAKDALTVLTRVGVRYPGAAEAVRRLVAARPDLLAVPATLVAMATEDPAPLNAALDIVIERCHAQGDGLGILSRINEAIPSGSRVHQARAVAVTEMLVEHHRDGQGGVGKVAAADLAGALNDFGVRLSTAGEYERARAALGEAVEQYDRLRNGQFERRHAAALTNLAALYSKLDRQEEAYRAGARALKLLEGLGTRVEGGVLPDIAHALNNVGMILRGLGRCAEAAEQLQCAIGTYERLAVHEPETYRPFLARSLRNLGVVRSQLGDRLDAIARAVGLYRELAQAMPDSYMEVLAAAAADLRDELMASEPTAAAVDAARAGVDARELLAERDPRQLAELAVALRLMVDLMIDAGIDEPSAPAYALRALGILHRLSGTDAHRYAEELELAKRAVARASFRS
ncbi:trypsin-like peptidase domain-containing protein [Streptomyces sp. NPDC051576]|uniref:trypsin-like peptidase domain-containing protein n=1 Tax=Streptomyces sp. NPDC051576 TaxID=3155803 RepID=UPI003424790B